ncbi:MAG: hypothetical protein WC547_01100 [Candidatus Omnitrophota bacterium]
MKPIIIIAEERDGKIFVSKEEFLKLIQDAYEQGRQDGNACLPSIPFIQHPCESTWIGVPSVTTSSAKPDDPWVTVTSSGRAV